MESESPTIGCENDNLNGCTQLLPYMFDTFLLNEVLFTLAEIKSLGTFLILLDLSAAFDTVDHDLLLSFLENNIGLTGSVLSLF